VPGMSPARHPPDDQLDAATWCRHLVPDRSVYAFLADHRHQLFPPEALVDLTRQGRGHPSVPAEVVASVMVLQALEGLSDREAVSALRRDIAWKVACGLRLDDEGFHPTVLVYWRNRIRRSQRPRRVFEVAATAVLAGRRRRVLDSTILEMRSRPRTRSRSWSRRSVGSAGCSRRPVRSSLARTTGLLHSRRRPLSSETADMRMRRPPPAPVPRSTFSGFRFHPMSS